ncbi:MAG: YkgJ family cysteine cluster protein [Planctomycetota bacterium]
MSRDAAEATPAIDAEPWYGKGLSFTCTQCGNCCTGPSGFVRFTNAEAKAMADRLGLTVADFRKRYTRQVAGRPSLTEIKRGRDYDCVFLTRDEHGKAGCSIYEVRPKQCRTWPFWPENIGSPREWADAGATCPGMQNGGKFYPAEQVRIICDSNDP